MTSSLSVIQADTENSPIPGAIEALPATKELRRHGFKDEHLNAIRFSKYAEEPLRDRPMRWHGGVPAIYATLMRKFLMEKLALEGHPEACEEVLIAALGRKQAKISQTNRNNAKKPRGRISIPGRDDQVQMESVVGEFASQRSNQAKSMDHLFDDFEVHLANLQLTPEKTAKGYKHDFGTITRATFERYVRNARKL